MVSTLVASAIAGRFSVFCRFLGFSAGLTQQAETSIIMYVSCIMRQLQSTGFSAGLTQQAELSIIMYV